MRNKNNILLFAICVSNVFAMAFAAMQYPAMKGFCESMPEQRAMPDIPLVDISRNIWPQIRGPQLTVPIFIGLCTLGIWGLAFQLHKQYAWSIYRSVQGDSRMRARYLAYEVSAWPLLLLLAANLVTGLCGSRQIRRLLRPLLRSALWLDWCPLHRARIWLNHVNSTSPNNCNCLGGILYPQGAQTTDDISHCK